MNPTSWPKPKSSLSSRTFRMPSNPFWSSWNDQNNEVIYILIKSNLVHEIMRCLLNLMKKEVRKEF